MDPVSSAADCIRVDQLQIFARVGVTENERASPQRLTLSITVWLNERFEDLGDDIANTTNYSALCVVARDFAAGRSDRLIETLASGLAGKLIEAFAVRRVELELRKFVLPDANYVAVMVTRDAPRR